jgi:glycosyltransferase involved in cell wall biosynthesis
MKRRRRPAGLSFTNAVPTPYQCRRGSPLQQRAEDVSLLAERTVVLDETTLLGRPVWRMRLCMVVHSPYPVGEPRVAREAAAAIDAGYEVEVVAMQRPGEPTHEVVDGALVIRLPVDHVRGAGVSRVVLEYLFFTALATGVVAKRSLTRRYDIVHVHNPPDFLIVAAVIPRVLGSRVIFDIHDPSPEMFAMRFPGRAGTGASLILRQLERAATAFADAVITVHHPYLRELVARGTPAHKVTVVLNSIDERLLPAARPRMHAALRIVYHGTVTPAYGVELLVDACARLVRHGVDLQLEITGAGDSIPDLRRRVASLGLSDCVVIEDKYLPHRAVLERVNGASVGVIPNLPTSLNRFALSSKLFEYVALGIPVVAASLPTIREYFSDDELQFFEPGNPASLAAALLAVTHDPSRAEMQARQARTRYEAYRWEVSAREYVRILDCLSSRTSAWAMRHRRRG